MPKTLINCPMLVSGCADRDSYDTQLLYFTCSSLSRDDKRIFLLSDRNGTTCAVSLRATTTWLRLPSAESPVPRISIRRPRAASIPLLIS